MPRRRRWVTTTRRTTRELAAPPQRWHQDCDSAVLAAVFHVTEGLGTEFAKYSPGNFLQLEKGCKAQYETVQAMWTSAESGGEPASPGRLPAGSLLLFNGAHVHRAPRGPAPGEAERRTIYLNFQSPRTDVDFGVIHQASDWYRNYK